MKQLKEGLLNKKNIQKIKDFFDRFKNGDIMQVRCETYYMFTNDMFFIETPYVYPYSDYYKGIFFRDGGYLIYQDYDKNLNNNTDEDFDIITVYRPIMLEKSYKQEKLTQAFLKDFAKKSRKIFQQ